MTDQNYSASDAFLFRTDDGWVTTFKSLNIPAFFFDKQIKMHLFFFTETGKQIKTIEMPENDLYVLEISKNLIDYEGIGYFHAFYDIDEQGIQIVNRCYCGYSKNSWGNSFVHGNLVSALLTEKNNFKSPVLDHSKNNTYHLQKYFDGKKDVELVFFNPTNSKKSYKVSGQQFFLNSREMRLFFIEKPEGIISVESDFFLPRPIVFSLTGNSFDVHHG